MASKRRHNPRRKTKGRFLGLYKLLAAIVILAALTVACVIFFRVRTVAVTGVSRYSAEEIIAASGIQEGDYLVTLSPGRIVRQIRAGLPYVESVSIHRVLPDAVEIEVEEANVAAAVRSEGIWWLINSAGKLLESIPEAQVVDRPVLTGVDLVAPEAGRTAQVASDGESHWQCALALLSALEERGELPKLNSLDCGSLGTFTVRYDKIYTLLFPATIDFQYVSQEQFLYFFSLLDEAMPQLEEEGRDIVDFTLWESTGYIYARRTK